MWNKFELLFWSVFIETTYSSEYISKPTVLLGYAFTSFQYFARIISLIVYSLTKKIPLVPPIKVVFLTLHLFDEDSFFFTNIPFSNFLVIFCSPAHIFTF